MITLDNEYKPQTAAEKLQVGIVTTKMLESQSLDSEQFSFWREQTKLTLRKIFGETSSQLVDFESIKFTPFILSSNDVYWRKAYLKGLKRSRVLLKACLESVQEDTVDLNKPSEVGVTTSLETVLTVCERFHKVAWQLLHRHERDKRTTLEIADEYDVQDLMHALLHIYFDDIRREEYVPSCAGKASRIDFLLKRETIGLELKMVRNESDAKSFQSQLIDDIKRYKAHQDCQCLVCFVYDTNHLVKNPRGVEDDLSEGDESFPVHVLIRPS